MLQSFWRLFSSLFQRAGCEDPAGAEEDAAKEEPPVPNPGDQAPKMPPKLHNNKEADPSERRSTILLVVGPAEHFTEVTFPRQTSPPRATGTRRRGGEGDKRVGQGASGASEKPLGEWEPW